VLRVAAAAGHREAPDLQLIDTMTMRPIDSRPVPPVAGIDLEHSLNYLDLAAAGEEFIYGH